MYIRKARAEDLPRLMEIYSAARAFMRSRGNRVQWGGGYPSSELVAAGIAASEQWVVEEAGEAGEAGEVVATFWFSTAAEPTYAQIFDGAWLSDGNFYGVVHRLASDGSTSGVGAAVLQWCLARCGDLRVDTHRDNSLMQSLLRREGFTHCGTILLADGSPRDAFERVLTAKEAKNLVREQVLMQTRHSFPEGAVALYYALPGEPSLGHLLDKWLGVRTLALPTIEGEAMNFREYTDPECLRKGRFGIMEPHGTRLVPPAEIGVMMVPGVAYTADGQRLGRGGGFYDRYLANPAAAHIHKVGICPPHGLVEWLPTEPHDVAMDEIVVML